MLKISEHFYSIQGEGASVGVPAYFIRLQGCNLMCGGPNAQLMKEGKATWWCDSELIWRSGNDVTVIDLISSWQKDDILDRILSGQIHLVWTGGEPTLPKHVQAITEAMHTLNDMYPQNDIYNEIETNGTIVVPEQFYTGHQNPQGAYTSWIPEVIQQVNCSPKLANSGMAESMRKNPDAIEQIKNHRNGWFKFVVSCEDDIWEIQEDWILPFKLNPSSIIIMPGVDNREDLAERTRFLFEMTKKYGYRGVTRQHILAWNRVTGV